MATDATAAPLQDFLQQNGIPFETRDTENFDSLRRTYTGHYDQWKPIVIVRPRTKEEVADIVSMCVKTGLKVTVRGGGHEMFGRCSAADAVSIDLRDLRGVSISPDKSSVHVGGGVTSARVQEELHKQGLQVASGACAYVGFVSWSMVGGFGPFMHSYGLGCDQIIGAKLVTGEGKLVEADEALLKGLRGGGGCLGIVVELTVRAHPLDQIQAGSIMFDAQDMPTTLRTFFNAYNDLVKQYSPFPNELYLLPCIWILPQMGPALICSYIWNGPASDESKVWLDRVASLAPLMPGIPGPEASVQSTTPAQFLYKLWEILPENPKGRMQSANVTHYSPEVIEDLITATVTLPKNSVGGVNIHTVRGDSPSCAPDITNSVFPFREPHIMFELLVMGTDDESIENAKDWCVKTRNALMSRPVAVKKTYLALTAPEYVDVQELYGDNLDLLKQLKKQYDPEGTLVNTVPSLPVS